MPLLDDLVRRTLQFGGSDLHLEPGLPAAIRVDGRLRTMGEPVGGAALLAEARRLLPGPRWAEFATRRSADLSRTLGGARCRINVLHSSRGVGFAVRLLSTFTATLESLNLHPELARLAERPHGLVLLSGPTGSGKSSTVAGLVEHINRTASRHVVTLEQPIEHVFRPRKAYIRQREVGRDTPSFDQGLLDSLREDPDVIVVGEMRRPETMRLTLNAAETGHLVFSTVHSSSCPEALARVIAAFAPEAQPAVCAQLADALVAVVCQRLVLRPDLGIRVPECEVLVANDAVRAAIRTNGMHKLQSILQMGAADGSWSFDRYRRWLDQRGRFFVPRKGAGEPLPEDPQESGGVPAVSAPAPAPAPRMGGLAALAAAAAAAPVPAPSPGGGGGVLDLDGFDEDLSSILSELE
jgi:twitching motility protein PilT